METKTKKIIIILILLLLLTFLIAIIGGNKVINPLTIVKDSPEYDVIMKLRLPRIISAIMVGMTLATSGLLIQVTLKNQLADSSILGFQSGATLMAMIIMLIFPSVYYSLPLFAFLGGLLVYFIVFAVSKKFNNAMTVIVCGIAISAIVRSIINLISLIYAENIEATLAWSSGSLSTITIADMQLIVIYSVILLLISLIFTKQYDLLYFDDLYLKNLGINVSVLRLLSSLLAILLASVSVSFVGTIGFVGLIAPHISRRLVTNTMSNLFPVNILVGGLLVLACDTIQRILIPIYEIPVGITLSLIGGTYLLYLILRRENA